MNDLRVDNDFRYFDLAYDKKDTLKLTIKNKGIIKEFVVPNILFNP